MSGHVEVVESTSRHGMELARNIRDDDRREIWAQAGIAAGPAVGLSMGGSILTRTGLVDGDVACIWGVARASELDDDVGQPWLLGTGLIERNQFSFLSRSRKLIDEMQDLFPVLENHVDARNKSSIRWLRWLGFDILPVVAHGPFGLPFHPFRRVRL